MSATTHVEIYRPFKGTIKRFPLRPLVLAWSGVRLGFRKKLPAFFLFTPPAIVALVYAIRVHLMFTFQEQASEADGMPVMAAAQLSNVLGNVARNIFEFMVVVRFFALLAITWYGSALIADDKRLGANLLYFSRPLTRAGYMLGKLLSAMVFGSCAVLLPVMLICAQASLSSPDWSFLKEEWPLILKAFAFSILWVFVVSCIVLSISSLVKRRTMALSMVFGVIFVLHGMSQVAAEITGNGVWGLASLFTNFSAIADQWFDQPTTAVWDVEASYWVLTLITLGSLFLLSRSVKRMEVVA
ncbi:MAG: ABC-type transport system involved in multi-copper enzyme maturation permease subunit [Planctomycetota bacterium]|jgi:ABC-type transport system involved in multi-copper enzyme maturation permease subunit